MIIAMTGKAGSGKDAVGKILVRDHGFKRMYFAEPLKEMTGTLLRMAGMNDEEDIHEWIHGKWKETPCPYLDGQTPRHAMQTLGTEWGRECMGNDFWVNILTTKLAKNPGDVVITDCRFDSEWIALRDRGAWLWRRDGGGLTSGNEHASESGVSSRYGGMIIPHQDSLNDLKELVDESIEAMRIAEDLAGVAY